MMVIAQVWMFGQNEKKKQNWNFKLLHLCISLVRLGKNKIYNGHMRKSIEKNERPVTEMPSSIAQQMNAVSYLNNHFPFFFEIFLGRSIVAIFIALYRIL